MTWLSVIARRYYTSSHDRQLVSVCWRICSDDDTDELYSTKTRTRDAQNQNNYPTTIATVSMQSKDLLTPDALRSCTLRCCAARCLASCKEVDANLCGMMRCTAAYYGMLTMSRLRHTVWKSVLMFGRLIGNCSFPES